MLMNSEEQGIRYCNGYFVHGLQDQLDEIKIGDKIKINFNQVYPCPACNEM